MRLNENRKKSPIKFYQKSDGSVVYKTNFMEYQASDLDSAFREIGRKDFLRDMVWYYDDIVDAKIGQFIPSLSDEKYKGMKFLGYLELEIETLNDPFWKNSKQSSNYLAKNREMIPLHQEWIRDMKTKEMALVEMFEPEKTSNDLICKHCGAIIPKGTYYERYRNDAYHLECIWDKLLRDHDRAIYKDAQEYFFSLQKYIGNWPTHGFDVEGDYLSDLVLVRHNLRIANSSSLNSFHESLGE